MFKVSKFFIFIVFVFGTLGVWAQLPKKLRLPEYLIEIGDYDLALAKLGKLQKKADVNESIILEAYKSEIYFKKGQFEKSLESYTNAKTVFAKNDSAYKGGVFLLKTGLYQSDYAYLNSIVDKVYASAYADVYWAPEALLAKASLLEAQGFQNSLLNLLDKEKHHVALTADGRQDFLLKLVKARCFLKMSDFKKFKEVIDTLNTLKGRSSVRNTTIAKYIHELNAEHEIVSNKNYRKAAESYEKAYSFSTSIKSREYHKERYLFYTIVNYKRADKELQKQRFLREAELVTYQKAGNKDLLIYDLAKAQISHIDGDFEKSGKYLKRVKENIDRLPLGHYVFDIVEKLKYDNYLQAGQLTKASKVIIRELDSLGIYKNMPNYQRLKLKYLKHEVFYGDDFKQLERIKKESYNKILITEIGLDSKENVEYLDLFSKAFKLNSKFDSSYYYANRAYLSAIKIFDSKQIEYAYYTASMIQASMLAGVKVLYNTYLSSIEKSSLKYVDNDDIIFVNTLEKLSEIYTSIGDYDKARNVLSLSNYLTVKVISSPFSKALYQGEIGKLYLKIGRYSQANNLLQESINICNNNFGEENRFKLGVLMSLSSLNNILGDFNASYDILQNAKKLCEKKYSNKSLEYSEYLKNESQYYFSIGDFEKSRASLENALEIQKKILPPKSVELAATLVDLAYISSYSKGEKDKIIQMYEQATGIIKETFGENIPLYADLLKRKGEFYSFIKDYEKSNQLLNQSLTYWNKLLGDKNTNSADIYMSLGSNYYAMDDYAKSVDFFSKSKEIFNAKFSEEHPKSTQSVGKLARAYYMQKKYSDALGLMEKVIPTHLESKNKFFSAMSFSEKAKFWNQIKDEFEFYNYLVINHFSDSKDKISKIYNNTLSTKALLLSNTLKIKRNILGSGDSSLISKYNEWIKEKEFLLYAHSQNKDQLMEQNIDLKALETKIENLDKAISKKSELFSNEEMRQKFTWQSVSGVLKDDEYVLEVVKVRKFKKYFTDSSQYLVMILNAGTKSSPEFVIMQNGKELETKYLSYYRNCVKFNIDDKYTYTKFWQPIKDKIPQNAIVYMSPDGCYSQINLETARNGSVYAIDENQFLYLTNSIDLASKHTFAHNVSGKPSGKIVLCGSPDFYTNRSNSSSVVDLKGTEKEVLEIERIAETHYAKKQIMVLTNEKVLEDSIKKIKSPIIFHIATHGYFKESGKSNDGEFKSNPLLNSGLLLGHSGDIIDSGNDAYVNQKSGILTAYEVSNMDFDDTRLVVLSACETGKGEVQAGEGVLGLVRAFTIAGGRSIVNSLFKVQDEATVKFMTLFYEHFVENQNEKEAISYAKKEMRRIYPQPLNWGSFILYEAGH